MTIAQNFEILEKQGHVKKVKVGLSPSKFFFASMIALKNDEKFLFHLKSSFCFQDI